MITMEPTMDPIEDDLSQKWGPNDLLTPEDAAKYLAWRWQRKEGFTVEGLRALRNRLGIEPAVKRSRISLYRRSQLDAIKDPQKKE